MTEGTVVQDDNAACSKVPETYPYTQKVYGYLKESASHGSGRPILMLKFVCFFYKNGTNCSTKFHNQLFLNA